MGGTFLCRYLMMVNPLPLLGDRNNEELSLGNPDVTSSCRRLREVPSVHTVGWQRSAVTPLPREEDAEC